MCTFATFGEKLKRLDGGESADDWLMIGEFCCCKTFVLTLGDVVNFGDVEMTDDGEEAELLVPQTLLSCIKLLMVLLRQILRSFDGSLFSLLLSDNDVGEMMNGFDVHDEVVGV